MGNRRKGVEGGHDKNESGEKGEEGTRAKYESNIVKRLCGPGQKRRERNFGNKRKKT